VIITVKLSPTVFVNDTHSLFLAKDITRLRFPPTCASDSSFVSCYCDKNLSTVASFSENVANKYENRSLLMNWKSSLRSEAQNDTDRTSSTFSTLHHYKYLNQRPVILYPESECVHKWYLP
jgi:hypothetical protein